MSSITTSAIDTPNRRSVERTCDDLAIIVLAAVGLIASLTFRDYGLGWDDYTHAEYADLLLRIEVFAAAMTFQATRTCKTI